MRGARARRPPLPLAWSSRISFSMRGREKASVLPVPVRARPMRSRPSLSGLNVAPWMGKSFSMPRFDSAACVSLVRLKLTSWVRRQSVKLRRRAACALPRERREHVAAAAAHRQRVVGHRGGVHLHALLLHRLLVEACLLLLSQELPVRRRGRRVARSVLRRLAALHSHSQRGGAEALRARAAQAGDGSRRLHASPDFRLEEPRRGAVASRAARCGGGAGARQAVGEHCGESAAETRDCRLFYAQPPREVAEVRQARLVWTVRRRRAPGRPSRWPRR